MEVSSVKKYAAEAFGTFVLTLFGCGSAAVAGATLGTLGIALAFGLSIIAMAFVIGNVSGCHINPAVSLGLFLDKRLSAKDLIGYWVAQFIGGLVAAAVLALIISMCDLGGVIMTGLGCNGFGEQSAVGLSVVGALIVEVILTCVFVLSVLGSTADERTAPYAGIIIGLTLAFVHIMGIPLTGTSVNPARSFGPAAVLAASGDVTALSQVWVFIVAPLVGAALAALIWAGLKKKATN
ncbi:MULTISPECIES: aquaporin [Gordonibacter]|uniref:Aquaporin n=1 Tax=Gordonibacter faecis TaxID=3047475 RepID=A0ABT7DPR4_9ACTN|nr:MULTISPECIES: aquaporin [unclassified Gordonibacter]MDJ1651523.1 aquaporin [Gordonibacter sp. KGMB12511]HIW75604.1 aquaporin [Candidatus Gordonibacter avicola]